MTSRGHGFATGFSNKKAKSYYWGTPSHVGKLPALTQVLHSLTAQKIMSPLCYFCPCVAGAKKSTSMLLNSFNSKSSRFFHFISSKILIFKYFNLGLLSILCQVPEFTITSLSSMEIGENNQKFKVH